MRKNAAVYQTDLFEPREAKPDESVAPGKPLHGIHFGTSTWSYPGWVGLVYSKKHPDATGYLREYAGNPLFSTVGADFTFYQPPDPQILRTWNEFLPPGFAMVFKVWDEITVDRFGKPDQLHSPRRVAGSLNPHYLNTALFEDAFLARFEEAKFRDRIGALLFEFRSSTAWRPLEFLNKLEKFLGKLPAGYPYAVEIREPKLLHLPSSQEQKTYFAILRSAKVNHVFNHWDRMPSLAEQMTAESFTSERVVSRILTPLKMPYEVAKKKFAPYAQLLPENILPQMRQDVLTLCLEAIRHQLPVYILVNNRSEGCAPQTIRALREMLQSALSAPQEEKAPLPPA
jgi:uncharacterized protein YecE (DUF72 family)